MFKIVNKSKLASQVTQLEIESPLIAQKAEAGQFIVLITGEKGERIPLTLSDWNRKKGTITVIFQVVGWTTAQLDSKNAGDCIEHILGPLGHVRRFKETRRVICIGGGVGIAELFPISRAFKETGNYVIGIIGARNKDMLILKDQMHQVCNELHITTDDGSYRQKGFVTDVLKNILNSAISEKIDLIYAIGPVVMMRAVSEITRSYAIKTIVSLNPIMVDATGMCGACRCTVDGKVKFACVDGPEFDAHSVDFQELEKRLNQYKKQEQLIGKIF